jgi:hypothetical protein
MWRNCDWEKALIVRDINKTKRAREQGVGDGDGIKVSPEQ